MSDQVGSAQSINMSTTNGIAEEATSTEVDQIEPVEPSSSTVTTTTTTQSTDKTKSDDDNCTNEYTMNDSSKYEHQSKGRRIVIEDFTRFSESKIWDLMMTFYDNHGVLSWANGIVPYFVTSNAFIARSYAKIISGFFMDICSTQRRRNMNCSGGNGNGNNNSDHECFYIVEVGGGTGKLAFYILKHLEQMKGYSVDFPFEKIVYVLTDFTQSNIQFWEQHESLKPFVDDGRLEFAKFEAVNDTTLKLQSGKILRKGDVKNPMCIIANYLIDTLCNDAFQVEKGLMKEGLISLGVKENPSVSFDNNGNVDFNDPEIINNLLNEYKYNPISADYYSNLVDQEDVLHCSRIISWYENYFTGPEGSSLLIPIGFLNTIRHLSDISSGKAIIITGDKGNSNPDYFRGLSDPHIAVHGSFSIMVNFHAICLYIQSRGGFSLTCNQEESALQVNCFVLNGDDDNKNSTVDGSTLSFVNKDLDQLNNERKSKYPILSYSFEECINTFNPNDFFVIQKSLKEEANPSLLPIISLLKLSNWDPDVFYKFRDEILTTVSSAGPRLRQDLNIGISKIWDNYYHLGNYDNSKDIVFELGRLCYGLSLFEKALIYYQKSSIYYGDHHITFHNAGLCYFSLLNFEEARINFNKALGISPTYTKSKTWLEKVEKEILILNSKLSLTTTDYNV